MICLRQRSEIFWNGTNMTKCSRRFLIWCARHFWRDGALRAANCQKPNRCLDYWKERNEVNFTAEAFRARRARSGGQHPQGVCRIRSAPSSLTAARGRPPLHKVENFSNFIRQIFNGRELNDTCYLSCAQKTRLDGRPSGRSDYGKCNDNTYNIAKCLFARQRDRTRPAPFSSISFPARGKRYGRRRHSYSVAVKNSTSGESGKELRAFGAALRPPVAKESHPFGGDGIAPSGLKKFDKSAENGYPKE